MAFVDQLLNLIGLVLWLSWRSASRPAPIRGAGTLLSNLKPVETRGTRRWPYPLTLVALVAGRPLLYAPLAHLLDWTPTLSPGPVTLAFRADEPARLLAFSVLSFAWNLLLFHSAILLLAVLLRRENDSPGLSRWVRELAGRTARWPLPVALLLPMLLLAAGWAAATFWLGHLGVLPPAPPSAWRLAARSLTVGAAVWLPLRWLFAALLTVRLIHEYVYLGEYAVWEFVRHVGNRLLGPLAWLPARLGRFDFTPLLAAALVLGGAQGLELALTAAYQWFGR